MNAVNTFLERQYGNYNGTNIDNVLHRLCVHEKDSWNGIAPSTETLDFNPEPPIFTAKFANAENYKHILAIANEDGKIALQNTNVSKIEPMHEQRTLDGQQSHNNAVFDLEWMPGQMKFISASGDHTARLWEVGESRLQLIREFNGHTRSVKTTAFRHEDPAVFGSGGRDGAILIWDIRASINVGSMARADNIIYRGHAGGPGTPHAYKRRARNQTPELPPNVSSSSITGLVFQDDNTLISCGAGDGIIKVWDLRRNYTSYKREPLPKFSIPYPGTSTFKGYTSLLIDNDQRLKLYVNCMDNNIYCYNLATYSKDPIMRYTGLRNSTFYIKSSLSADGQYLLSGSSDEKAYIWNVKQSQPLLALCGHSVEVTCVAWSHANELRLVTCSDDTRHKIWRIGPESIDSDEKIFYRGTVEKCRDYSNPMAIKKRLKTLEYTPRSMKRLAEKNETTPSTGDVVVTSLMTGGGGNKRNFSEMIIDNDLYCYEIGGNDKKRPFIETRARRLFSPTASTSTMSSSNNGNNIDGTNLTVILEEIETENDFSKTLINYSPTKQSPLRDLHNQNQMQSPPPSTLPPPPQSTPSSSSTSINPQIYSPTLNLPNYVITGEAPHLPAQSPKRKLKENVDWLTKIRKQKLLSTISSSQKLNGQLSASSSINDATDNDTIMSPRLKSIKESSMHQTQTPTRRRRSSHSDNNNHHFTSPQSRMNERRNSEATILRFFTVTHSRSKLSTLSTTSTATITTTSSSTSSTTSTFNN